MSEPNNQSQTTQRSGPPLPEWMFDYIVNPLMSLILRSPLHGLVSERLLLLTFSGRKSGREYTTPVGYVRGDDTLYVLTESPWWKNMRNGAPVRVRLQGKTRRVHADASADPQLAARVVKLQVRQSGKQFAERRFGVELSSDNPALEELAGAVQDVKVVRIDLQR